MAVARTRAQPPAPTQVAPSAARPKVPMKRCRARTIPSVGSKGLCPNYPQLCCLRIAFAVPEPFHHAESRAVSGTPLFRVPTARCSTATESSASAGPRGPGQAPPLGTGALCREGSAAHAGNAHQRTVRKVGPLVPEEAPDDGVIDFHRGCRHFRHPEPPPSFCFSAERRVRRRRRGRRRSASADQASRCPYPQGPASPWGCRGGNRRARGGGPSRRPRLRAAT